MKFLATRAKRRGIIAAKQELPKATVLVMLYDSDGKIVKKDARSLLGVRELEYRCRAGKGET